MTYVVRDPFGFSAENALWGQQQKVLEDATTELVSDDGGLDKALVGQLCNVFPFRFNRMS